MKKYLLIIAIPFALGSCTTGSYIKTSDAQVKLKRNPSSESIKVYSTSKVDQAYDVLGQVMAAADAGEEASWPVDLLKDQAAILGADAILDLRLEFVQGYWVNGLKATGTAVKFK